MSRITDFNVEQLIERWYQQEQDGVQFPVDFDIAWQLAGYSTKGNAKRLLTAKKSHLVLGDDYLISSDKSSQDGRSSDSILLSCDSFKHFCLMAGTQQGREIRQYFIECEKSWKLVQKVSPAIAEQIELLKAQKEVEALKAQRERDRRIASDNELKLFEKREAVIQLHSEQTLALIDGRPDVVVEKVEKVVETIVVRDGRNINFEGQSTKQMAISLGFKSGTELERWLEKIGRSDLVCQGLRVNQAPYIPTEKISEVKKVWADNRSKNRQMIIGE